MRKFLMVGMVVLMAGPAWAGCENYTDGSLSAEAPRADICFKGKCETTAVDVSCGNSTSFFVIYANGWRVDQFLEDDIDKLVVSRNDRRVTKHLESLTIDGEAVAAATH